jgi:hypothetical protein
VTNAILPANGCSTTASHPTIPELISVCYRVAMPLSTITRRTGPVTR